MYSKIDSYSNEPAVENPITVGQTLMNIRFKYSGYFISNNSYLQFLAKI